MIDGPTTLRPDGSAPAPDLESAVAEGFAIIAEELDGLRFATTNGNQGLIRSFGELKAQVGAMQETGHESAERILKGLGEIAAEIRGVRDDMEQHQLTTNERLTLLERVLANGHASAE